MATKSKTLLKKTDNPREYKMLKKKVDLSCPICPPNRGENAKRRAKHGPKKPKHKDHR